jgi:hypothetical protein
VAICLLAACDPADGATTSPSTAFGSDETETTAGDAPPAAPAFATLPPVDRFTYPTGTDDVVVQVLVSAPLGPDVPLLTVYGDGDVVAGTKDGWRVGTASDLEVQGLLDDADSVGLLDEALVLRGPEGATAAVSGDTSASVVPPPPPGPDFTIRFDVDGRVLEHELDLVRIERPPAIWAFLNTATTANRFGLTERFEPGAWIACSSDGCEVVPAALDASSRPVLPHEDPSSLVDP